MPEQGRPGGLRAEGRLRFLPTSVALGLFVGDIATMLLRDEFGVGRAAVSALLSIAAFVAVRWVIRRRVTPR
jgi:hypothetical protein